MRAATTALCDCDLGAGVGNRGFGSRFDPATGEALLRSRRPVVFRSGPNQYGGLVDAAEGEDGAIDSERSVGRSKHGVTAFDL